MDVSYTFRPQFIKANVLMSQTIMRTSFIMSALTSLVIFMAGAMGAEDDAFARLAKSLESDIDGEKRSLGVGDFVYENTSLLSAFSSLLRDELEIALAKAGKFKIVTRNRLADLELEGQFQGQDLLEPGSGVQRVSIAGVQGIVRGRYYTSGGDITVFAEIAWLDGGEIQKAKICIPAGSVQATIWPDDAQSEGKTMETVIRPQNLERSLAHVEDIAGGRLFKINQDFRIELTTTDGRRALAEKDNVTFRVRSTEECHIAVLCHQTDGTTIVLFPNKFASNTLIPANKPIDVPGTQKSGFEIEIGPPFGSDVVEVVACTQPTELHKMLATKASANDDQLFQTMPRGMAIKGIQSSLAGTTQNGHKPLKWGHANLVVSTFPKQ